VTKLGIINDPVKTFKNQALKIWATKEFAERLAFSRTTWFLHAMYCFCIITIIDTAFIIVINDVFVLINFYDTSDFWLYNFIEEVYYNIHPLVEVAILYFWLSPKIIRTTLLISKAYSNKERAFFEWIEFKIKVRFPSYKTSAQRARERLDKPKKKGKLNIRFQKFLQTRNQVERFLIRAGLWVAYSVFLGAVIFFMLSATSDTFNEFLNEEAQKDSSLTEQEFGEIQDEFEQILAEQSRDVRPTGLPPSTIFDVFISKPTTVIP